jgi:hypothetical protein
MRKRTVKPITRRGQRPGTRARAINQRLRDAGACVAAYNGSSRSAGPLARTPQVLIVLSKKYLRGAAIRAARPFRVLGRRLEAPE